MRGSLWIGSVLTLLIGYQSIGFGQFSSNSSQISIPSLERSKSAAEQAYQQGEYQKSIDLTSSVLRSSPNDHVAFYLRGSSRIELGMVRGETSLVRSGISDARMAISLKPSDNLNYYLPYFYGMTSLAAMENNPKHAKVVTEYAELAIQTAKPRTEQKSNLLYQRALAFVFLRNFDAAIQDLDAAIEHTPAHLGVRMALAETYAAVGKKTKAIESFASAVHAFPANPLVYNNRGMFHQQQGNTEQAIVDFSRAIALDKNYFVAFTNRGFASLEEGQAQVAEIDFTTSLRINPKQPAVFSLRGTSRLAQGKAQESILDYQRVVQFDSRNPVAHADLGFAMYFANDVAGALAEFNQAVRLDPKLRYLEPWRISIMMQQHQPNLARESGTAALNKDPKQRDWIDNLVMFVTGDLEEVQLLATIDSKDESLKVAQQCEAHYFVGQQKRLRGDRTGAAIHFRKAIQTKASQLSAYRGAQFAINVFSND